jgi:DNA-binding LytR/AlgR family response regulator
LTVALRFEMSLPSRGEDASPTSIDCPAQGYAERTLRRPAECVAARRRNKIVLFPVAEVWAFESRDRLSFVHTGRGHFEVDLTLREIESSPVGATFLRVHRSWLANFPCVRELALRDGLCCIFVGGMSDEPRTLCVPVARALAKRVRRRFLDGTIGIRKTA